MTADIIADILYVHFENSANHNILRKRVDECRHVTMSPSFLMCDVIKTNPKPKYTLPLVYRHANYVYAPPKLNLVNGFMFYD